HGHVRSAIGFTEDDLDFRNGGCRVGEQQLSTVAYDAAVLLLDAGQEPRHVDESDEGDVEGVAESDQAAGLGGGIDIQGAGEDQRLVGNDAHGSAQDPAETDHDIHGMAGLDLEKVALVHDAADYLAHVVTLFGLDRHDIRKFGVGIDIV